VYIVGVEEAFIVMQSKDQPKKLGFKGSDGKTYYFLLKHDNKGDIRKEARFIHFANFINIILENEAEAKKRDLSLHTYSITPLSRNTCLIEWLDGTMTFKSIISTYWNENNVKSEVKDILEKFRDIK